MENNALPESLPEEEVLDQALNAEDPPPQEPETQESAPEEEKIGFDDPRHPDHPRFQELREKERRAKEEADYYKKLALQATELVQKPKEEPVQIETVDDLIDLVNKTVESKIIPVQQTTAQMRLQVMEEQMRSKYSDYDDIVNQMMRDEPETVQSLMQSSKNPADVIYRMGKAKDIDSLLKKAEERGRQSVKKNTVAGASAPKGDLSADARRKQTLRAVQQGKLPADAVLDLLPTPYDED